MVDRENEGKKTSERPGATKNSRFRRLETRRLMLYSCYPVPPNPGDTLMSKWIKAAIAACASLTLFALLVVYIAGSVKSPAQLPTLGSADFQLLIFSDKFSYKLGEMPHITAQIINRSEHGVYFHDWSPTKPPGLEVFVKRPADALPMDKRSGSSCAPTYSGYFRGWWGNGYSYKFTYLVPGGVYPLEPCHQVSQGLFSSPGTYDIHIVFTNETEAFATRLANVGTSYINYTYITGKQEGTWIAADADEFAASPYDAPERHLAVSLGDKGPWIGEDPGRRRVTLREMLHHAPRMTLRSKVLTIRIAEPLPFPEKINEITLNDYANDFLFPRATSGRPRHQRIVEKLKGLGDWAFPALELVISGKVNDQDKAYALTFFQLVPGDRAIPRRAARELIENHLANPPSDQDSLPDVVKAAEILGEFGNSRDCGLLIEYLQGDDDSASWVVFNAVKKLADDEMLESFVEVLAQKVGYAHTGSLFHESIFLWGEEVVIDVEVDLLRLALKRSRGPEERSKLSKAFRVFGEIRTRFTSLQKRYESEDPHFKKLIESEARDLLLKESLTLDRFNTARYSRW